MAASVMYVGANHRAVWEGGCTIVHNRVSAATHANARRICPKAPSTPRVARAIGRARATGGKAVAIGTVCGTSWAWDVRGAGRMQNHTVEQGHHSLQHRPRLPPILRDPITREQVRIAKHEVYSHP